MSFSAVTKKGIFLRAGSSSSVHRRPVPAVTCISLILPDRAVALLRSASSTVVRTAGATFTGGSRDGGVITDGGESNSSLFRSLGGFVNVGPGGFGGGEMFPRGGGDSFGKGMNAAPGTGEVSAAQEGATILGSALASSVASRYSGLGPVTRGGGIGFNLDPPLRGGGGLSPLSFQPGNIGRGFSTSVSLTGISLEGMPAERPRVGGRPSRLTCSSSLKAPLSLPYVGE